MTISIFYKCAVVIAPLLIVPFVGSGDVDIAVPIYIMWKHPYHPFAAGAGIVFNAVAGVCELPGPVILQQLQVIALVE